LAEPALAVSRTGFRVHDRVASRVVLDLLSLPPSGQSSLLWKGHHHGTAVLDSQSPWDTLRFIQPGKPHQNAFIERFNRTYRYEVLDAYVFDSLQHVRLISEGWMRLYNEERPHRALDRLPPMRFAERLASPEISSYPVFP
jgi:hypothetical protein